MTDFDNSPGVGEPAGTDLELGYQICARYGNSPGLLQLPGLPSVVDRGGRFQEEHLPLLGLLQRRWSNSTLLPKGWTDPIYAWPVFPMARTGSARVNMGSALRSSPAVTLRPVPAEPAAGRQEIGPQDASPTPTAAPGAEDFTPLAAAAPRETKRAEVLPERAITPAVEPTPSAGIVEFGRPVFKRHRGAAGPSPSGASTPAQSTAALQRQVEPLSPTGPETDGLTSEMAVARDSEKKAEPLGRSEPGKSIEATSPVQKHQELHTPYVSGDVTWLSGSKAPTKGSASSALPEIVAPPKSGPSTIERSTAPRETEALRESMSAQHPSPAVAAPAHATAVSVQRSAAQGESAAGFQSSGDPAQSGSQATHGVPGVSSSPTVSVPPNSPLGADASPSFSTGSSIRHRSGGDVGKPASYSAIPVAPSTTAGTSHIAREVGTPGQSPVIPEHRLPDVGVVGKSASPSVILTAPSVTASTSQIAPQVAAPGHSSVIPEHRLPDVGVVGKSTSPSVILTAPSVTASTSHTTREVAAPGHSRVIPEHPLQHTVSIGKGLGESVTAEEHVRRSEQTSKVDAASEEITLYDSAGYQRIPAAYSVSPSPGTPEPRISLEMIQLLPESAHMSPEPASGLVQSERPGRTQLAEVGPSGLHRPLTPEPETTTQLILRPNRAEPLSGSSGPSLNPNNINEGVPKNPSDWELVQSQDHPQGTQDQTDALPVKTPTALPPNAEIAKDLPARQGENVPVVRALEAPEASAGRFDPAERVQLRPRPAEPEGARGDVQPPYGEPSPAPIQRAADPTPSRVTLPALAPQMALPPKSQSGSEGAERKTEGVLGATADPGHARLGLDTTPVHLVPRTRFSVTEMLQFEAPPSGREAQPYPAGSHRIAESKILVQTASPPTEASPELKSPASDPRHATARSETSGAQTKDVAGAGAAPGREEVLPSLATADPLGRPFVPTEMVQLEPRAGTLSDVESRAKLSMSTITGASLETPQGVHLAGSGSTLVPPSPQRELASPVMVQRDFAFTGSPSAAVYDSAGLLPLATAERDSSSAVVAPSSEAAVPYDTPQTEAWDTTKAIGPTEAAPSSSTAEFASHPMRHLGPFEQERSPEMTRPQPVPGPLEPESRGDEQVVDRRNIVQQLERAGGSVAEVPMVHHEIRQPLAETAVQVPSAAFTEATTPRQRAAPISPGAARVDNSGPEPRYSTVLPDQISLAPRSATPTSHLSRPAESRSARNAFPGRRDMPALSSSEVSATTLRAPQPVGAGPVPSVAVQAEGGAPRPAMVHTPHFVQRSPAGLGSLSGSHGSIGGATPFATHRSVPGQVGRNVSEDARAGSGLISSVGESGAPRGGILTAPSTQQGAPDSSRQRPGPPNFDINGVVDQIYQMLVRRLASERMRKGL